MERSKKVVKQLYSLTDRPQLIDLNGDLLNFRVEFQAISVDPSSTFDAVVLTQEQLDSVSDWKTLEMKVAKGKIGGSITADTDKYQNYFLILRSSLREDAEGEKGQLPVEVEVEVSIQIEELETSSFSSSKLCSSEEESGSGTHTVHGGPASGLEEDIVDVEGGVERRRVVVPIYRKPWFWVALISIALFIGLYYYYQYQSPPSVLSSSSSFSKKGGDVPKKVENSIDESPSSDPSSSSSFDEISPSSNILTTTPLPEEVKMYQKMTHIGKQYSAQVSS